MTFNRCSFSAIDRFDPDPKTVGRIVPDDHV